MLNANNGPRWGSDPEAFLLRDGVVIGSEKLIPAKGLRSYAGKIVRDGVQFELNPTSAKSVPELAGNISLLFQQLSNRITRENKNISISFDGLVEVSREELDSLSPGSRILGCMPSYNVYEERPINVDPVLYRKRSAGGHIHFGISDLQVMEERRRMVPVLDILVGNTAVLFDRDPGAAERRQNYGRAGECRFPDHGLEYRTTSNFWLRDYTLMEFVFGIAEIAYALTFQSVHGDAGLWNGLAKVVNIKRIVQAIDTNDFELALKNFKRILPFLKRNLPKEGFVLTPANLDAFVGLAQKVSAKGIEAYFPAERIITNWTEGNYTRFGDFLQE